MYLCSLLRMYLQGSDFRRPGLTATVILAIAGGLLPGSVWACQVGGEAVPMTLSVDRAATLNLKEPATRIFVTNPDIADIDGEDPTSLVVYGLRYGTTSLCVTYTGQRTVEYLINVRRAMDGARESIKRIAPTARVEIAETPRGMIATGAVDTPAEAAGVKAVLEQFLAEGETLTFQVTVASGTQVNLKIRVAEISRELSTQLGLNWDAVTQSGDITLGILTGRALLALENTVAQPFSSSQTAASSLGLKSGNIAALIDALQSKGLVSILAEPNLTAASGASASFLAGGELPIPVAQGSAQGGQAPPVTLQYKQYGVGLNFSPTVLDEQRINVKVNAEVSEVSDFGAVIVNGFRVPSLTVRRVDTTVDLAAGQTFALAGLFKDQSARSLLGVPGINDIPILGALFRSSRYQRSDSELVILVTPYIVAPVGEDELSVPTDNVKFAPELEQILLGRLTGKIDNTNPAANAKKTLLPPRTPGRP